MLFIIEKRQMTFTLEDKAKMLQGIRDYGVNPAKIAKEMGKNVRSI